MLSTSLKVKKVTSRLSDLVLRKLLTESVNQGTSIVNLDELGTVGEITFNPLQC